MSRLAIFFITVIFLFSSCAVQHKTIVGIRNWSYPQNQFDEEFDFRYFDHVLDETNNKRAARWAARKNIHVIGIRLMNNGKKPIHGTQLAFYNGNERAEIIHNEWLAKKVRQRISPLMILFIPAWIFEYALFHRNDDSYDDQEPALITEDLANKAEAKRQKANFNLHDELMKFQLANQVLFPNEAVYGIIGIRCRGKLKNLRVVKVESDVKILSVYEQ